MAQTEQIKQSFDLEEILFDVRQIASNELFPGYAFVQDKERAILLPDQKKVLHFCSEGYRLISNREILVPIWQALVDRYGEANLDIRILNFDDRKFYVSFIIKAIAFAFAPGDSGHPTLEVSNSYDGSLKFSLAQGFFRLRGTANLMAFQQVLAGIRKHSNRYGPRFSEKALELLDQPKQWQDQFQELVSAQLASTDITKLADAISQQTHFPKRIISEAAHQVYSDSKDMGLPLSAWTCYSGFNYVLNTASIRMHPEFRGRVDLQVLDTIRKWVELRPNSSPST